jgi:hypothetical protein
MGLVQKAVEGLDPPRQDTHFGFGNPEDEKRCSGIRVFMRCVGRLRMEQQQISMATNDTINDARNRFGRKMDQMCVRDERGFVIRPEDHTLPLSHFSSKCRLNLDFTYEQMTIKEWTKETVASVAESAPLVFERSKDLTKGGVSIVTEFTKEGVATVAEVFERASKSNENDIPRR